MFSNLYVTKSLLHPFCKLAFMIYPFLTGIKQDDSVSSFMECIISQGLHCTIRCLHAKLKTQPPLGRHSPWKLRFQLPWATSTKDLVQDTTRGIIKKWSWGPLHCVIPCEISEQEAKQDLRKIRTVCASYSQTVTNWVCLLNLSKSHPDVFGIKKN